MENVNYWTRFKRESLSLFHKNLQLVLHNLDYLQEVKKAKYIIPYINIMKSDQSMMLVRLIWHIKAALCFLNKEINNGMDGGVGL